MLDITLNASFKNRNTGIEAKLSLFSFEEDGMHVIFSPALDLFGYGKTDQEAKDSFLVALEEFITYTTNKKTLFKELQRLGWDIKGSKQHRKIKSPDLVKMASENKELSDLLENKNFTKYDELVEIPELA